MRKKKTVSVFKMRDIRPEYQSRAHRIRTIIMLPKTVYQAEKRKRAKRAKRPHLAAVECLWDRMLRVPWLKRPRVLGLCAVGEQVENAGARNL